MPSDGEITLRIRETSAADEKKGFVPSYDFDMIRLSDGTKVGEIDLRMGYVRNTYYGGNIGYNVIEAFRGNGYAGKACKLVFQIACAHQMPYLIITCDKDNIASRKTLEHLGGELLETCVPASYSGLYRDGARAEHCIFRYDLNAE
ncbi:MAG: GNAT family N-acetyltransferase [Eubacteriales bacterium]|nr:GNAT family N-acetyltransferase [Eubacteriales bacterium]